jgi:surfeit locus 1 family protein
MPRIYFLPRFRIIPALAALLMFALTFSLGQWQSGKAQSKAPLEAHRAAVRADAPVAMPREAYSANDADGRKMRARGSFMPERTLFWDNQVVNRIAGFAVLTPFKLEDSQRVVLIDRGVIKPGAERNRLPEVATPTGVIEIEGRAYVPPKRTLSLGADNAAPAHLVQTVSIETLRPSYVANKLELHDFILRQQSPADPAFLRLTDAPPAPRAEGMTVDKHRGYAFQWYSLAALTLILFLFFSLFSNERPS